MKVTRVLARAAVATVVATATVAALTAVGAPALAAPFDRAASVTGPAVTGPAVTGPAVTGPAVTGPAVTGPVSAGAPAADSAGRYDASLRVLAQRAGVRIGTAVDTAAFAADATYREHVRREFSTVTAENVMKWESTEPTRGVHQWGPADRLVDDARRNGQRVRGHTLVWHNQNPSWLTAGNFSTEELRAILRAHIVAEVRHFRGRVWHWDVVNEVFTDDGQLRRGFWLDRLGPGYIADAFRWARQADPGAVLFVNDYNNEGVNAKSDAYYRLVRDLRAQGVPIDGYGMQGHLAVQYGSPARVLENLQRFEALGLQTAFTEVDVRMPMPPDATKLRAQAHGYSELLSACLLARRCVSYTVWGFTDRYSWVPGFFAGQGAANLLTEDYQPKPAYLAVRDALRLAAKEGRR